MVHVSRVMLVSRVVCAVCVVCLPRVVWVSCVVCVSRLACVLRFVHVSVVGFRGLHLLGDVCLSCGASPSLGVSLLGPVTGVVCVSCMVCVPHNLTYLIYSSPPTPASCNCLMDRALGTDLFGGCCITSLPVTAPR